MLSKKIIVSTIFKKRLFTKGLLSRISAIILLFTGIITYNSIFKLETISGIGIYSGLFNITTISQILESFSIISNKFVLIFISFTINFILLKLINYNLFGSDIKDNINKLFKLKYFFIYYFIFIFIFMFFIKYHINVIHLEPSEVIVKGKVGNVDITVSGNLLKEVFNGLGEAAVFSVGAKLGLAAVTKQPMGSISRIGVFIGSGAASAGVFRGVRRITTNSNEILENGVRATKKLDDVVVSSSVKYELPNHPYWNLIFGRGINFSVEEIIAKFTVVTTESGKKIITAQDDLSPILTEDKLKNPDWGFTPFSPLENNDKVLSYLIDILTDSFIINTATVYLLFMLTLIFICKLLINKKIEFKFLTKIKIFNIEIGNKINNIINWYITMWQKSSNIWIFYILIVLIISNIGSLYFLYHVLTVLKRFI